MSPGIAILSAAITVMALVLSIFGAAWLNQRNTERLIEQLDKRFDQRFSALESRLDRIERQLETLFKPVLPSK
jgi:hypothetical protein